MTNDSSENKHNPLYISKQKRRGLYGIILIVILLVFLPRIVFNLNKHHHNIKVNKYNESEFVEKKKTDSKEYAKKKENKSSYKSYKILKSKTNLNSISIQAWKDLGLSDKQAKVVFSIVSKGIKNEKELESIKYLPKQLFLKIKDSIIYEKIGKEMDANNEKRVDMFSRSSSLNLNVCSYEELLEIPGIGHYTAKSILKFRDALGGYYKIEQLMEVYNMRIENYTKMRDYFLVDTSHIKKININTADYQTLVSHPYISSNQANSIVKIRLQKNDNYQKIEEILQSVLIDEETFNKLQSYIVVE